MVHGNGILTTDEFRRILYGVDSQNEAVQVANITNEFAVVPQNVSAFRDLLYGNGNVDYVDYYNLETSAQSDGNQALESARIGQYRPGTSSIVGIYFEKEETPVGYAEWGYGRDPYDDGAWFRYDSDGSVTCVVSDEGRRVEIDDSYWQTNVNGEEVTDQNGDVAGRVWGFDPLDGTGESKIDYDPSYGRVHVIKYTWYGAGPVTFYVLGTDHTGYQRLWPIVTYEPNGRAPFSNPNHPIFARIDNDGTATADSIRIGGRQYTVIGNYISTYRETENFQSGVSVGTADYVPILAIRRKSGFEGVEMDVQQIEVQTDNTLHAFLMLDPTFNTAPTWQEPTDHDASETAIEVATQPDANMDGTKYSGFIGGAGKNKDVSARTDDKKFPFPRQKPMVLYAKALENSATTYWSTVINELW